MTYCIMVVEQVSFKYLSSSKRAYNMWNRTWRVLNLGDVLRGIYPWALEFTETPPHPANLGTGVKSHNFSNDWFFHYVYIFFNFNFNPASNSHLVHFGMCWALRIEEFWHFSSFISFYTQGLVGSFT